MKKTLFILLALALCLLSVSSCTVDPGLKQGGDGYVEFNASLDGHAGTKTYLDGVQVKWEASDEIGLWYGTLGSAMTGCKYFVKSIDAGDPRQATFNGLALASADYMAVYPLSAAVSCSKKGKLAVAAPTNQTALSGSFGSGVNIAVAYSSTTDLSFKNVGGLLAIKVRSTGGRAVKSIRLTGVEALSGEVEIEQAALTSLDVVTDGVNYLSMNFEEALNIDDGPSPSDDSTEGFGVDNGSWGDDPEVGPGPGGGPSETAGPYYLVALPGSHSDMVLTFVDENGNTMKFKQHFGESFNIVRNGNTLLADVSVPAAKWKADAAVYINEVSDNQIELYNPGVEAVDLSGWVLRCGEGSWAILPGTSIAAGGFHVVSTAQTSCTTGPMFEMGSAGFTLSLENGKVADSVDVPALGGGETYGRLADGGDAWGVFSTGSMGETNANGTPKTVDTDIVVLNELQGNGTKYIELYNAGEGTVSLAGWTLEKDEGVVWTGSSESMAAGGYLVLYSKKNDSNPVGAPTFKGGLSAKKNVQVVLKNASGDVKDTFRRGEKGSDWGDITLAENTEASFSRVPNGNGAWKYAAPTCGAANGEKTGTIEQYPAANGTVILNEINGNDKFIELCSTATDQKISLEDMTIQKDAKLVWTGQPGYSIEPGGYVLLYSTDVTKPGKAHEGYDAGLQFDSGLSAKKAVRVQLFDANGTSLDDFNYVTYSGTAASASYGRNADGVWYYQDATPGAVNTDGENIVTGLE